MIISFNYNVMIYNVKGFTSEREIFVMVLEQPVSIKVVLKMETWHNYVSGPKSAPNSDSFWLLRLFKVSLRVFCGLNATILLVTYPPRSKWASSEKTIFFCRIMIFCNPNAGPLSETKTHCMVNWPQHLSQLNLVWHLYAKFISMMAPKCSIVENDGELVLTAFHTYFLPQ